ncbi:pantoate--beta-alanine ligase [Salinithrix halophila]|uniref:Pantothenate synthetase n=1 Tax=Salinithrix halophila TaxID=1485204 RepID=A0ABV8JL35_9BACL
MRVVKTIEGIREALSSAQRPVGFIPTMGSLHAGHISLIERARRECATVVVSVFVNPLQFGPTEDFDHYPRDLDTDARKSEEAGTDFLFAPATKELYPAPPRTRVTVSGLTDRLCGASRPGHFDGVATVVNKLLHIVSPDRVYFGLKDAQQLAVIQRMTEDLNLPVRVVPCPTLRESDGLAMSSRNVYLSPEEREQATVLNRALSLATEQVKTGRISRADEAAQLIRETIRTAPQAEIDYVEVLSYPDLERVHEIRDQQVIAATAVRFGNTRLIDNVIWPGKEDS